MQRVSSVFNPSRVTISNGICIFTCLISGLDVVFVGFSGLLCDEEPLSRLHGQQSGLWPGRSTQLQSNGTLTHSSRPVDPRSHACVQGFGGHYFINDIIPLICLIGPALDNPGFGRTWTRKVS